MSGIVVFGIVIDPTVQDLRKIIEKIINLIQEVSGTTSRTLLAILIIKLGYLLYALNNYQVTHTFPFRSARHLHSTSYLVYSYELFV